MDNFRARKTKALAMYRHSLKAALMQNDPFVKKGLSSLLESHYRQAMRHRQYGQIETSFKMGQMGLSYLRESKQNESHLFRIMLLCYGQTTYQRPNLERDALVKIINKYSSKEKLVGLDEVQRSVYYNRVIANLQATVKPQMLVQIPISLEQVLSQDQDKVVAVQPMSDSQIEYVFSRIASRQAGWLLYVQLVVIQKQSALMRMVEQPPVCLYWDIRLRHVSFASLPFALSMLQHRLKKETALFL